MLRKETPMNEAKIRELKKAAEHVIEIKEWVYKYRIAGYHRYKEALDERIDNLAQALALLKEPEKPKAKPKDVAEFVKKWKVRFKQSEALMEATGCIESPFMKDMREALDIIESMETE